jgi:hypothetical protein
MDTPELKSARVNNLIERAFIAVFAVLFVYAIIAWFREVRTGESSNRAGFVCLTGAMLLQPVAVLVRSRSRAAFWTILVVSAALLSVSIVLVAS